MKNQNQIPQSFLSHCSSGKWTVVHNGMPLCAETSKEFALSTASRFKLKLPGVYWESAQGAFVPEE
jgi:hypothetical protein